MIQYSYKCKECDDVTTLWRKLNDRDNPAHCPECGEVMKRVWSTNVGVYKPSNSAGTTLG